MSNASTGQYSLKLSEQDLLSGEAEVRSKQLRLLRTILLGALILLSINIVMAVVLVGPAILNLRTLGPSLVGGFGAVVGLLVLWRKQFLPAAIIATGSFLVADTWEFARAGLNENQAALLMFLVPAVLSGVVLRRAFLLTTTAAILGTILTVHISEFLSLGLTSLSDTGAVLLFSLVLILLTLFFDRFGISLRKSLVERTAVAAENQRLYAESTRLNKELEQRVESRTRELVDLNRELESFSYMVSHDLRSPLRSVRQFSEILLEDHGADLPENGRDYLNRVVRASSRMGDIITDLLSLSQLGRDQLVEQRLDLSELACEILRDLTSQEPERSIQWNVEPNLTVDGDPRLLRIALENLLGNALKFSANRDTSKVHVGWDAQKSAYYVRDNGTGFNMEYADMLFAPFRRLHSTDEFEGSGIGLTTVERIVKKHGGRIWAHSAEGAGATFFFTLPGSTISTEEKSPAGTEQPAPRGPRDARPADPSTATSADPPKA